MKYVNTTKNGIYTRVPGRGHQYVAPGREIEVEGSINVPGLSIIFEKIPVAKKTPPKPVVNTIKEETPKNDIHPKD